MDHPAIFIETTGADKDPAPDTRPLRSLRGQAAGRAVRALADFRPPYGTRELAGRSDTPAPTLSRVIDLLVREAIVERESPRGRIVRVDWQALLRRSVQDYDFVKSNQTATFLEPRGLAALLEKLRQASLDYAVTATLAADARGAAVSAPRLATLFVADIDSAAEALKLRPAESGGNVLLARPFNPVAFERTMEKDGVAYAAPSQVAADLLTGAGAQPGRRRGADRLDEGERRCLALLIPCTCEPAACSSMRSTRSVTSDGPWCSSVPRPSTSGWGRPTSPSRPTPRTPTWLSCPSFSWMSQPSPMRWRRGNFQSTEPGIWKNADKVQVDLLVPESLGGPGRRGARLDPPHGNKVARKVKGLEAALVDHTKDRRTCGGTRSPSLVRPACSWPSCTRSATEWHPGRTDRLDDKDALDVLRLLPRHGDRAARGGARAADAGSTRRRRDATGPRAPPSALRVGGCRRDRDGGAGHRRPRRLRHDHCHVRGPGQRPLGRDREPRRGGLRMPQKSGRNDPCPCGSGKKYKKCCLPADQARESETLRPRAEETDRPAPALSLLARGQPG